MADVLKLKTAKEAIKGGLRSDAYIDTRPRFAKDQDPYCKVARQTIHNLLDDYAALVKVAKRAGYKVVQPSGVRDIGALSDKVVPEFLKKDYPEPKAKQKRRTRL